MLLRRGREEVRLLRGKGEGEGEDSLEGLSSCSHLTICPCRLIFRRRVAFQEGQSYFLCDNGSNVKSLNDVVVHTGLSPLVRAEGWPP